MTIYMVNHPTTPRPVQSVPACISRVRSVDVRALELTARDCEILTTLTARVRVLTTEQVGRTWWPSASEPESAARRRLRALSEAGLVTVQSLLVHPEIELTAPAAIWHRGLPEPDFSALAPSLAKRWTEPERATSCVAATQQAAAQFGGSGGRLPRDSEATHDIHLAAVHLRMAQELPTRAASWTSEAALRKGQGIKIPDAIVRDGKYQTAIEFGGSYSADKLAGFHRYCEGRGLGYELW